MKKATRGRAARANIIGEVARLRGSAAYFREVRPGECERELDSPSRARARYSHSIVPGGFEVMSRTTRLTSRISLIIRDAILSRRS